MKKKLLVLGVMLLCVVTVLSACTSPLKFKKAMSNAYNDENPTLTKAEEVMEGYILADQEGDLAIFDKSENMNTTDEDPDNDWVKVTTVVYNLATGQTLATVSNNYTKSDTTIVETEVDVEMISQWGTVWFAVITATETTTIASGEVDDTIAYDFYDINGTKFGTSTNKFAEDPEMLMDLIRFDGKVYRINGDGGIAQAFEISDFRALPEVTISVNGFYYAFDEDDGLVFIYDNQLNLVARYETPSYSTSSPTFSVMSNGDILLQYRINEGEFAEDFTYIADGGNKYTLKSFLLDAEKGKLKEVKLDYVIEMAYGQGTKASFWDDEDLVFVDSNEMLWEAMGLNGDVKNVAMVYYIEDERVDYSESAIKLVALNDKGKIKGEIKLIDNQEPLELRHPAANRWIVTNVSGQSFLLNEKGEVLGEVTGLETALFNGSCIVLNGKIYDWDLNMKYDLQAQGAGDAESYTLMSHGVFFVNEDGEWMYYNAVTGEAKTIIAKDTVGRAVYFLNSDLYYIVDTATEGKTKVELYNDQGALLTTIETAVLIDIEVVMTADSNNSRLLKVTTLPTDALENVVDLYRISVAA